MPDSTIMTQKPQFGAFLGSAGFTGWSIIFFWLHVCKNVYAYTLSHTIGNIWAYCACLCLLNFGSLMVRPSRPFSEPKCPNSEMRKITHQNEFWWVYRENPMQNHQIRGHFWNSTSRLAAMAPTWRLAWQLLNCEK